MDVLGDKMNGQLKSKTNWYGAAILCLGIVEANASLIQEHLGSYYGYFLMSLGIGSIILRQFTTKPVSEK